MADVIGGIVSGVFGSDSAEDASAMQADAANRATDLQGRVFDTINAQNEQARNLGDAARNQLATLLGIAPTGKLASDPGNALYGSLMKPFQANNLSTDPGYQFRLAEGTKAINTNAGIRGGLYSGATLKALQNYGQGAASQEFQNAFNRDAATKDRFVNYLTGAAGMGSNAAGQSQAAGMNYANNVGNNMMGAANVGAAATLARGNVWGDAVNNAFASGKRNNWWGIFGTPTNPEKPYWE